MGRIDILNLKKYLKYKGDNKLARIGHVNAVINELENKINSPVNPSNGDGLIYDSTSESWISSVISGGGLEGTQYVFVKADGTDVENAQELQEAYDTAQTMSPSATNRITIVCGMGNYSFVNPFVMDQEYIDLVSLDGNKSIIFNSAGINVQGNDVFIKGVNVGVNTFLIADDLNLLRVENCEGGSFSFGGFAVTSGTFIKCIGGDTSFGSQSIASGTFTNCQGGEYAFGAYGTASGTFTDCVGSEFSFGSELLASGIFINCEGGTYAFAGAGTASGTFNNCVGGELSFGGDGGTASGVFTKCEAGIKSFGVGGILSGKLYYCQLTSGTFETVSGAGITRLCIDGDNNENNQG